MRWGFLLVAFLAMGTPALAQDGIGIPEPTDMILFGLAVAGVLIGRRSSKAPPHDRNNDA